MAEFKKPSYHRIFYFVLGLYFILGLLNLQFLPIAWTDEIMNLDPALQFHKHGVYRGFLWPNPGSDKIFFTYPPLIEGWHILMLCFLPFDIFWMRLPFLMMHVATIYFIFITLKKISGNALMAMVFSMVFMFDKVVFEISRSMRVEVMEMFILALYFYLHTFQKSYILRATLTGLLVLAHLKSWPLVLVIMVAEFVQNRGGKRYLYLLISAIPMVLFFVFTKFQLHELYRQMFGQASMHSSGFQQSFIHGQLARFWPVYKEQPWVILIVLFMLFFAFHTLWKQKGKHFFSWVFLVGFLTCTLILAGHYRYWPPIYLCGFIMLADHDSINAFFSKKFNPKWLWLLIPVLIFSWLMRHVLALYQRTERNPTLAKNWIRSQIGDNDKTLILGEGIAFYQTQNTNWDYGMEMYPQLLHPEKYANIFFISRDSHPFQMISEYKVKRNRVPVQLQQWVRGETYAGLRIYRLRNMSEFHSLTMPFRHDYDEIK